MGVKKLYFCSRLAARKFHKSSLLLCKSANIYLPIALNLLRLNFAERQEAPGKRTIFLNYRYGSRQFSRDACESSFRKSHTSSEVNSCACVLRLLIVILLHLNVQASNRMRAKCDSLTLVQIGLPLEAKQMQEVILNAFKYQKIRSFQVYLQSHLLIRQQRKSSKYLVFGKVSYQRSLRNFVKICPLIIIKPSS